jgi:hypothetical protein
MKSPRIPLGSTSSQWPQNKAGILEVAQQWYDPTIAKVNDAAIAGLTLPDFKIGAEESMAAGSLDRSWGDDIALSFALNSINYQFWDLGAQGEFIRYQFEDIVGAMGMRTAFERAWADPESPLNQARLGRVLTLADIEQVFGDIPAAQSRVEVLNEMLLPRGPGLDSPVDMMSREIAERASSIQRLETEQANRLAQVFSVSYGDQVLKKAQLAISEVWVKGREHGLDYDCDLTAFADYQIPNILRAMGVLEYSSELAAKIDSYQEIPYESQEEKAIRGASLIAVEKIAAQAGVPVAAVDHYLWTRRKEAQTPFHLTFTTAY